MRYEKYVAKMKFLRKMLLPSFLVLSLAIVLTASLIANAAKSDKANASPPSSDNSVGENTSQNGAQDPAPSLPTDGESGSAYLPNGGDMQNGNSHGIGEAMPESGYWFRMKTDAPDGIIYLRKESFGKYTGTGEHGFEKDFTYASSYGDIDPLYYQSMYANALGYTPSFAQIETDLASALTPYYTATILSGKGTQQYEVAYYSYQTYRPSLDRTVSVRTENLSREFIDQEQKYRKFVYDKYLEIDEELKTLLLSLAKENGIDPESPTCISDVAKYIRSVGEHNEEKWGYTDYPETVDMVTHFLTEEKSGVCRHFAASATMMLRALGIPARYTVGFVTYLERGVWKEYRNAAHAWVEVYMDGQGWVVVDATFDPDNIIGEAPPTQSPPSPEEEEESEPNENTPTVPPTVEGEPSETPSGSETPDASGRPNTPTLPPSNGKIKIEVTSFSTTQTYDGSPISFPQAAVTRGELLSGHELQLKFLSKLYSVGSCKNAFYCTVKDTQTGIDVSNLYDITLVYGTLKLEKSELTVALLDEEKFYDGQPLIAYRYRIVSGTLPPGYTLHCTVIGAQTEVGKSYAVITGYSIIDNSTGEDVTYCFSVTTQKAILTVK